MTLMFKAEELTLTSLVEMIEAERPDWLWMTGRCGCHADKKDGERYAALAQSPDYEVVGVSYNIATGEAKPMVGSGYCFHEHGSTALEALSRVYAKMMTEVK